MANEEIPKAGTITRQDVGKKWYLDKEHQQLVMVVKLLLWITGVLMVLIVGLGMLTFSRNRAIDKLQDSADQNSVILVETKQILTTAIEEGNNPELVAAFQRLVLLTEEICQVLDCEGG